MKTLLISALVVLSASSVANAQSQRVNVRGTIAAFDGNVLTVTTPSGPVKVALADTYQVRSVVKSDLSNVAVGTYIGTAAEPEADGTLRAQEVLIFPEAMRGAGEGFRPWDLTAKSTMTNATVGAISSATVEKVEGRMMTLKYKDGEKRVFVPANAPVVTFAAGDKTMLVPGAHVVIIGAIKHEDGSLTTAGVNVGKDGLTPPM